MSWNTFVSSAGIRGDSIFTNYESALNHYDNVKPIRGRQGDQRPLGRNRTTYSHCQVRHNPLVDSVSAVLYDTECVTIFDNGLIKLHRGSWVSPSTANFIEACLPSKFGTVRLSRRRIIYTSPTKQEYVIPENGLMLQVNINSETRVWESADVIKENLPTTQLFEYKADRKVMNAIRKNIKPFLDAVFVMSSMSTEYGIEEIAQFYPQVIDGFIKEKNEHNEKMRLKEAGDEAHKNYYGYFYDTHIIRSLVGSYVGAPRLSFLSSLAETIKARGGDTTGISSGYRFGKHTDFGAEAFMELVRNLFKDDAETVRRVMLSVVCNEANYGYDMSNRGGKDKLKVPTLFGEVEVPNMVYDMNGVGMENFIIDVIKYLYADLIFKKTEVPQGTLPSLTNEKYVLANQYLIKEQDIVTRRHAVL